ADVAVDPHLGPDTVDLGPETSISQGILFHGTRRSDRIVVERRIVGGRDWMVFRTNFGTFRFPVSGCRTVIIAGRRGSDFIAMHRSAARFWRARFRGGRGNDTLIGGHLGDILRD